MNRMKEIINKISEAKDGPRLLREDPKKLAKSIGLSNRELQSIFNGDVHLVYNPHNPLAGRTTLTFTTGSTITGDVNSPVIRLGANSTTTFSFSTPLTVTAGFFGPRTLEDLSQPQLVELTAKILSDKAFANKVNNFLNK